MLRFTKRVALIVKLEQTLATNPSLPPLCIIIIINKTWQQTKDRLCVSNKRTMAVRRRFANRYGYTKERKLLSVYVPIFLYFFFISDGGHVCQRESSIPSTLWRVCVCVSLVCLCRPICNPSSHWPHIQHFFFFFFFFSFSSFLPSFASFPPRSRSLWSRAVTLSAQCGYWTAWIWPCPRYTPLPLFTRYVRGFSSPSSSTPKTRLLSVGRLSIGPAY